MTGYPAGGEGLCGRRLGTPGCPARTTALAGAYFTNKPDDDRYPRVLASFLQGTNVFAMGYHAVAS